MVYLAIDFMSYIEFESILSLTKTKQLYYQDLYERIFKMNTAPPILQALKSTFEDYVFTTDELTELAQLMLKYKQLQAKDIAKKKEAIAEKDIKKYYWPKLEYFDKEVVETTEFDQAFIYQASLYYMQGSITYHYVTESFIVYYFKLFRKFMKMSKPRLETGIEMVKEAMALQKKMTESKLKELSDSQTELVKKRFNTKIKKL